jgi:hypothetical protein
VTSDTSVICLSEMKTTRVRVTYRGVQGRLTDVIFNFHLELNRLSVNTIYRRPLRAETKSNQELPCQRLSNSVKRFLKLHIETRAFSHTLQ